MNKKNKKIRRMAKVISNEVVRISYLLHCKSINRMEASDALEKCIKKAVRTVGARTAIQAADFMNKVMLKRNAPDDILKVRNVNGNILNIKIFYKPIYTYLNRFNPVYDLSVGDDND